MILMEALKYCPSCKRVLPLVLFWKDKALIDGLSCYCIICLKAKAKRLRDKKREVALKRKRIRVVSFCLSLYEREYNRLAGELGVPSNVEVCEFEV